MEFKRNILVMNLFFLDIILKVLFSTLLFIKMIIKLRKKIPLPKKEKIVPELPLKHTKLI
jgi:hypothetical protein